MSCFEVIPFGTNLNVAARVRETFSLPNFNAIPNGNSSLEIGL